MTLINVEWCSLEVVYTPYPKRDLYILPLLKGFSLTAQASFFLICVGDSAARNYCPLIMLRPGVHITTTVTEMKVQTSVFTL